VSSIWDEPAYQCRKISKYDINYSYEFTFIPAKITVHFLLAYKLCPDLERYSKELKEKI